MSRILRKPYLVRAYLKFVLKMTSNFYMGNFLQALTRHNVTRQYRHNSTLLYFGSSRMFRSSASDKRAYWHYRYKPSARASATICRPSFTLWDVNVNVDLASGNLTKVTELRPFSSASNFSSLSANITGAPLFGRAYNGIKFNLTNPDQFVLARQNATLLQLPAAVYQSALQSPQGLVGSFEADRFVTLSAQVYVCHSPHRDLAVDNIAFCSNHISLSSPRQCISCPPANQLQCK